MDNGFFSSLQSQLNELWIARYIFTANVALATYDYGLGICEELKYVRPTAFSPAKIVYYLNRYIPLISATFAAITTLITDPAAGVFCFRAEAASGALVTLQLIVAQAALSFRAYAVWECNRLVGAALLLVFLTTSGLNSYYAYLFARDVTSLNLGLLSDGCIVQNTGPVQRNLFVLLLSESFTVALLVLRAFMHRQRARSLYREAPSGPPILITMLKDGIAYFICIVALTIGNILVNHFIHGPLQPVFVLIQVTLQNILCVRLYLHLRTKHWRRPYTITDSIPLSHVRS